MAVSSDSQEFWDRVDREMRIKKPGMWKRTKWLLRIGVFTVLFSAAYWLFSTLVPATRGYYVTPLELSAHPIIWALFGAICIILGAFFRFRAMGPIVEHLKRYGIE